MLSQATAHISLSDLLATRHAVTQLDVLNVHWPKNHTSGKYQTRLRGRGMDFDQVRRYQAGDDVRSIDWRVTARSGETHSRVFQEERERPVFLLVEQSPQLFFSSTCFLKSSQAAILASLFGWSAMQHQDRVGGIVFNDQHWQMTKPTRERSGLLHLLQQIVSFNQALKPATQTAELSLEQVLLALQAQLLGSCTLVLICDQQALSQAAHYQLLRLAQKHELILLPLSDPLEAKLPEVELLALSQGSTSLQLDLEQQRALQAAWQDNYLQQQARWQQLAVLTAAPLLPINTAEDVLAQLTRFLARTVPARL